jgi:hypothetical protein
LESIPFTDNATDQVIDYEPPKKRAVLNIALIVVGCAILLVCIVVAIVALRSWLKDKNHKKSSS